MMTRGEWAEFAAVWLAIIAMLWVGGTIYVVLHFIVKFW